MADENTQVAPVAGAEENATQDQNSVAEQEKSLKAKFPTLTGFVYLSDPDNADPVWHHKVIPVFGDEANVALPWQVHAERPADNLKDPVWAVGATDWSENDKDNQGVILQQAIQKLAELDKKSVEFDQANDKFDQAMKTVQKAQTVGTQQSEMITKTLGKLMESQENSNKLMMAIQKTVMGLAKQDDKTQPATDASNANTPTETTNDNK